MTKQDIVNAIEKRLALHAHEMLGTLRQDEYKADLFQLFVKSYWQAKRNPSADCITGDGLLKEIANIWCLDDSDDNRSKRELLQTFCAMWREWQFAWDHYVPNSSANE